MVLGKTAAAKARKGMEAVVADVVAAEAGADVLFQGAKQEGAKALAYMKSSVRLSSLSLLAKRGLIAADVISKTMEVVGAPEGARRRVAFEKGMEFIGEGVGYFAGGAAVGYLAFPTEGTSLIVSPTILVGATAAGGSLGVDAAKLFENIYDGNIRGFKKYG